MKIIDCFPFFQELDLLEVRMRFLNPYVDLFVVQESELTYTGQPKPWRFPLDADWFQPFRDKTRLIQVKQEDLAHWETQLDRRDSLNATWRREHAQRQAFAGILPELADEDLLFLSDLDEVWNPAQLDQVERMSAQGQAVYLEQQVYYYSPDLLEVTGGWNKARAQRVGALRGKDFNTLRDGDTPGFWFYRPQLLRKAGWHLSWLGGLAAIQHKFHAFSHEDFVTRGMAEEANILKAIADLKPVDPSRKSKRRLARVNPRDHMPEALCALLDEKPQLFLDLEKLAPREG